VPGVAIAVIGNAAQHSPYLIRRERLELLGPSEPPSTSAATFLVNRPSATSWAGTCESAEHVIAENVHPRLASSTTRPDQLAATQLHNQIVDVSAGQVLNRKRAGSLHRRRTYS
jgi:hypothetical protein